MKGDVGEKDIHISILSMSLIPPINSQTTTNKNTPICG